MNSSKLGRPGRGRIQRVWLRAALDLGAAQIAAALGWQVGSVRQVHSDYLRLGEAALRSKSSGDRYRQNLTLEQEKALRLPFLEQVEARGVLVCPGASRLGSCRGPSGASLGRAPGSASPVMAQDRAAPRHPKGDEAACEAFKKLPETIQQHVE